jgi:hypothetical protein
MIEMGRGLVNVCEGKPPIAILPVFTSRVAAIAGISHIPILKIYL